MARLFRFFSRSLSFFFSCILRSRRDYLYSLVVINVRKRAICLLKILQIEIDHLTSLKVSGLSHLFFYRVSIIRAVQSNVEYRFCLGKSISNAVVVCCSPCALAFASDAFKIDSLLTQSFVRKRLKRMKRSIKNLIFPWRTHWQFQQSTNREPKGREHGKWFLLLSKTSKV